MATHTSLAVQADEIHSIYAAHNPSGLYLILLETVRGDQQLMKFPTADRRDEMLAELLQHSSANTAEIVRGSQLEEDVGKYGGSTYHMLEAAWIDKQKKEASASPVVVSPKSFRLYSATQVRRHKVLQPEQVKRQIEGMPHRQLRWIFLLIIGLILLMALAVSL